MYRIILFGQGKGMVVTQTDNLNNACGIADSVNRATPLTGRRAVVLMGLVENASPLPGFEEQFNEWQRLKAASTPIAA